MHSGRMFKARHISPLPPGERGRGRGPEVADQQGTSDGPDHLRPLPTRAALTLSPEGEGAVRRGLLLQGWSQDCAFLPNCQTVQSMHSGRMFKARHISPLPPGERGRGRGPEVADQHGTSDGPDHLRPLPNPLPRRERELFGVVCCFRGGRRIVPSYRTARQCNQCIQAGCSRRDTSPLSLLGRGAGGEGPKSQTSTEPLTGLITCALSLTLSPGGRGNCSAWSAASGVVAGLCLPTELPDSAINAFRQDVQGETHLPSPSWGEGPGERARSRRPARNL